jgi:hypothetical protein
MKKIILPFCSIFFLFSSLLSQDVLLFEDFEDATITYTTSITEFSDGSTDYFIRTDGSDISSSVSYSNPLGSFYFGAQDIDGEGAALPVYLNIDNIDIFGYEVIQIKIYLAEDDDGPNQDWDEPDFVHINYSIDNAAYQNGLWIENDGSTFNSAPLIDIDFDGTGDGDEITDNFQQFTISVSGIGSELDIEIEFDLDAGDEDIAIDNIEVIGTAITTPVDLIHFNVEEISGIVNINWLTANAFQSDHFTLEWSPDGIDFITLSQYIEVKNTREENSYVHLHRNPTKGLNYYRLTEVDQDGCETVFPVRSIRIEDALTGLVLQPNRVDNRLKILFGSPVQNGRLQIFNSSGQMVMNLLLSSGIDVLNTDVSELLPGQYLVRYVHAGGMETGRFVKI